MVDSPWHARGVPVAPFYQAFVDVVTPDYTYQNPIPQTYATTPEEALSLAYDYAAVFWPSNVARRRRFIERCTPGAVPSHRQAIAARQVAEREATPL